MNQEAVQHAVPVHEVQHEVKGEISATQSGSGRIRDSNEEYDLAECSLTLLTAVPTPSGREEIPV